MSSFDENLFGRIAVLNNYITREELDECVQIQRDQASQEHIGRILLDQGFLTDEQFDHIVDIRNKKVRRLLRSQEDYAEFDRDFGKLLVEEGLLDLDELESTVLEQQRLRRLNLHFNLVEVAFSRHQVDLRTVKDVLALQGSSLLRCAVCDVQYQVVDLREDEPYDCPRCQSALGPPVFLDPLLVEGVIKPDGMEPVNQLASGKPEH